MLRHKPNLTWIASYPKSGNTWFRAFISSLLEEKELDINRMKASPHFGNRKTFKLFTDIDSDYLTDEEIKILIPEVYAALSETLDATAYIKIHDAFIYNSGNTPIIPINSTQCAIYLTRNPLDVAGSFAAHMGVPVDKAIQIMNSDDATISAQKKRSNIYNQLPQLIMSWSSHVKSWKSVKEFPVLFLRYEDLLDEPLIFFSNAVKFLGLDVPVEKINAAIDASSFSKLKQQEIQNGFKEKYWKTKSFFRLGKAGTWINELTREQALQIVASHGKVMEEFGYDTDIEKYY